MQTLRPLVNGALFIGALLGVVIAIALVSSSPPGLVMSGISPLASLRQSN